MNTRHITLTMEEDNKIRTLSLLIDKQIEIGRVCGILGCTERTVYRMKSRFLRHGSSGLIHGNRGCKSPHKIDATLVIKILKLHRERYHDANDSHFCELLQCEENIKLGRSTLRRLLRQHGVGPKRKRRAPKHRLRRPRKEAFGTMLQLDASHHEWFGTGGQTLALHGAIDDATGFVWAFFAELETTNGYSELMRQVFTDKGLPLSLYTDRHSIFHPVAPKLSHEEQHRGLVKSVSQFGRAMKELGIQMIPAYSPQAKGRIERLWQTFQDRLVLEMQLAGIKTKEAAQVFLRVYLQRHNAKYAVKPKQREPVFRPCPRKSILDDILCRKEYRVVSNDNTVSYYGRILQIPKSKGWRTLAKKTVEIWDRPDGIIKIALNEKILQTFKQPTEDVAYDLAA